MDRNPFMPEIHWQILLLISDMPGFRSSSDSSHIESSANDMSQVSVSQCVKVSHMYNLFNVLVENLHWIHLFYEFLKPKLGQDLKR